MGGANYNLNALKARILRTYPSLLRDFHFYLMLKECNSFDKVTEAQCKQIIETAKRIADLFRALNEEETARNIHNYLVKNIRYDYADISNIENHNIVGPLVKGKGVCEGIAKTMQYILSL